jgi:hypothetical protein
MLMEEFRIISDFPKYEVSSYGRIRDIKKKITVKFNKNPDGYYIFKRKRVNRLVALAFISNPLNKPIVDHMDRLRTNNMVANLRWATIAENNINQYRNNNGSSGMKGVYYDKEMKLYFVRFPYNEFGSRYGKSFVSLDDAIIDRVEQMLLRYKDFVCHDEIFDYCQAVIRKGVNSMLL